MRQPEQEIGEVEAGAGERLVLRVEGAGGEAAEGEGAARVLVRARVELHAPVAAAGGQRVLAAQDGDGFGEAGGLVAAQHGAGIAEAAEVGEVEIGRAPVDGVVRNAADAELRGHVALVGEEGQRLAAVAAEGDVEVADDAAREGVAPAGADVHAASRRWNRGSRRAARCASRATAC